MEGRPVRQYPWNVDPGKMEQRTLITYLPESLTLDIPDDDVIPLIAALAENLFGVSLEVPRLSYRGHNGIAPS